MTLRRAGPLHWIVFLAIIAAFAAGCGDKGPHNDDGCIKNPTLCIDTNTNKPPVAVLHVDRVFGIAPLVVNFTGQCTDADEDCAGIEWNFGDGSATDTSQSVTHVYTTPGVYTATLAVTDLAGAVGTSRIQIEAASVGAVPPGLGFVLNNVLNDRWPPELKSLALFPDAPVANRPVTVVVDISNDSTRTDDHTTAVTMYYSVNNGQQWENEGMTQQLDGTWKASIPEQSANTKITYAFKAVDTAGNIYVEAVCGTTPENVSSDAYLMNDCTASGQASQCENTAPRGCMFPMASDVSPIDDEFAAIPDDLDLWESRIGFDDQHLFIDLVVESEITPGATSPLNIHDYQTWLINPDKPGAGTAIGDLLAQGGTLSYGPLLATTGGVIKPCAYTSQINGVSNQNDADIHCAATGRHLVFTLNRSVYGANPGGLLRFFSTTSSISNLTFTGSYYDFTRMSAVRIAPVRTFTFH